MKLAGRVALVTGGSRGVGRGVAGALAEAGATVYVTGRTVQHGAAPEPGTLEHVVGEIDAAGGRGIGVRCDHAVDEDIRQLFARIADESGRLDVLVNNVYSGVREIADSVDRRFWELAPDYWDRMNAVGLRSHYVASVYAARLMVPRRSGLIVNVSSFGSLSYLFNIAYGVGKAALDRMSADMAIELKRERVAVVSLWPGFVRTELTSTVMQGATAGYRRIFDAYSEAPLVAGRAVAALAGDPRGALRRTGTVIIAAEIARRYGLRDEAGHRPESPRSIRRFLAALLPPRWRGLAKLAPPVVVPVRLVGPVLLRFSDVLRRGGGFRNPDVSDRHPHL